MKTARDPEDVPDVGCGTFRAFNANTSLHGPKYITKRGTRWPEALLWLMVVSFAVVGCFYLVFRIISKWQSSPIITSIDTPSYDITNINFPAIIICPIYTVNKNRLIDQVCTTDYVPLAAKKNIPLTKVLYDSLYSLLDPKWATGNNITLLSDLAKAYSDTLPDAISLLQSATPSCSDFMLYCSWNDGHQNECSSLFSVVTTDLGYCCSFNIVSPTLSLTDIGTSANYFFTPQSDGDYDHQYSNISANCPATPLDPFSNVSVTWQSRCSADNTSASTSFKNVSKTVANTNSSASSSSSTPTVRAATCAGVRCGLTVMVDSLPCGWINPGTANGFKVMVHDPYNYPLVNARGFIVSPGTEAYIRIDATVTNTTDNARAYSNETRGCNFQGERQLDFFRTYSRDNCEMEHYVKTAGDRCNCKMFTMPGNYTCCDLKGMTCFNKIELNTSTGCLPACTDVQYTAAVSAAPFPLGDFTMSPYYNSRLNSCDCNVDQYVRKNVAVMNFFFGNNYVVKYKRDELYNTVDIISNIGGSLGLCIGFSLVSGFEIFFFFCLRRFLECKQRNQQVD